MAVSIKNYPYEPGADLDLYIYKPSDYQNYIGWSARWDNTYEIVDFTAPETGQYKVRINKYRLNQPSTHLAVAWFTY